MRVLIDPGDVNCRNLGDVAMLQAAVGRVRQVWPAAEIHVITSDAESLERRCPGPRGVSDAARRSWFADRVLLGRFHQLLPQSGRRSVELLTRVLRRTSPSIVEARIRSRIGRRSPEELELVGFLDALKSADLYVAAGQGTINDTFPEHARLLLQSLEGAIDWGKPTVMFGQGIGPLREGPLMKAAGRVLPRVGFIGLRERRIGPRVLDRLGVAPARTAFTGDDAVPLAYEARRPATGSALGVNLRIAHRSGIDRSLVERLRPLILDFAARKWVSVIPLPISLQAPDSDTETISLVAGDFSRGHSPAGANTVEDVIRNAGECRVAVTAAYHAAVFALAQGVPAICIGRSAYYHEKFLGLRDCFGVGCEVLSLEGENEPPEESLLEALERTWSSADAYRGPLLEAARRQVDSGRDAYRSVFERMERAGRAA